MKGDTIYKVDEFPRLPWDQLDPERVGKDWSVGRGGYGFDNQTWTLSNHHEDGSSDIWELPAALGSIFVMLREAQRNSTREEIRRVLGF